MGIFTITICCFIEDIALEISGNWNLNKINLTNLKRIESSGPIKIKISGNKITITDEEKRELVERLGLKDEEILVEATCLFLQLLERFIQVF